MKTLVPPPIYSGKWNPQPDGTIWDEKGMYIIATAQRSYGDQPVMNHQINAQFIAAAPAMAEALVAVWDHYASIDDLSRAEERIFRKVEDVLLAAGYTEAVDQE